MVCLYGCLLAFDGKVHEWMHLQSEDCEICNLVSESSHLRQRFVIKIDFFLPIPQVPGSTTSYPASTYFQLPTFWRRGHGAKAVTFHGMCCILSIYKPFFILAVGKKVFFLQMDDRVSVFGG